MGCTYGADRVPHTYATSKGRAESHVHHLRQYTGLTPLAGTRGSRRPWDAPAPHLNELGPSGSNYFRLAQTDELRRWHQVKLDHARGSPMARAKDEPLLLNPSCSLYSSFELTQSEAPSSPQPSTLSETRGERSPASRHGFDMGGRSSTYSPVISTAYVTPQRALPAPRMLLSARPSMAELMPSTPPPY